MDIMSYLFGFGKNESPVDPVEKPEQIPENSTFDVVNAFIRQVFLHFLATNFSSNSNRQTVDPVTVAELSTWIIGWGSLIVELPMVLLASCALARLIKANNVTPVYVINLLGTDLIQLAIRPAFMVFQTQASSIFFALNMSRLEKESAAAMLFYLALSAGNGFMVCIALERYLLVVHPLWYRCRRSVHHSMVVSGLTWLYAGVTLFLQSRLAKIHYNLLPKENSATTAICGEFCPLQMFILFIPFPLLLFFLLSTHRALRGSMSVTEVERRNILGVLVLALVSYMAVFLPSTIMLLIRYIDYLTLLHEGKQQHDKTMLGILDAVALALLYMSPLLDAVMYVFLRQDTTDNLQRIPCVGWLVTPWIKRRSSSTTSITLPRPNNFTKSNSLPVGQDRQVSRTDKPFR